MKKRFYFPFVAALSLGMVASVSSCSDDSSSDDSNKTTPTDSTAAASKPEAYMFYNEFVPDGGVLKVKGVGFDANTTVSFQGADGSAIAATKVELKSANEIWVTVPEGVGESTFVTFKNEQGSTESTIRFRDTRNVLLDFDTEASMNKMYMAGANGKNSDGTYSLTADADIAENYHAAGTINQYGLLTDADSWQGLSYAPSVSATDFWEGLNSSVFGQFTSKVNASNIDSYVVKFELNIPKSGAINGLGVTLGFTGAADSTMGNSRKFAACFQPAEVEWDKSDTVNGWSVTDVKSFYTDGWMTVTIPLTEFLWDLTAKSYITAAANLANGWELNDAVADMYANADKKSYGAVNASKLASDEDAWDYFGGLQLIVNPYDYAGLKGTTGKIAIDNVRIVPNDGNGAIYPKTGYGIPSQDYNTNPRTSAFK